MKRYVLILFRLVWVALNSKMLNYKHKILQEDTDYAFFSMATAFIQPNFDCV